MKANTPHANGKITGRFRTILVAPPWPKISREQLQRAPVAELADTECHLYLWISPEKVVLGHQLIERWGFEYRTSLVVTPGEERPALCLFLS